jgi:FlaG/FlaF family flagellin (archaellin)
MKKIRNICRRFRRSVRAVSPVIAVLLMIVIAVAAALFAYSWTMGYLDFLTVKTDQGVQVQAISLVNGVTPDTKDLVAYAQNVGPSNVTLTNVYVNDELQGLSDYDIVPADGELAPTKTATITIYNYAGPSQVTVKVVTADGNIFMLKKTVTTNTGGTITPTYLYRKPITITGVVGTQTNFPVLVTISGDTDIGGSTGGSGGSADGDHIYFTDSDGTTKLNHEIESFTGGASASLVAWVKVPSLTNNKVIYLYYGSDVAGGQENPTGVWDSNYQGVWHLGEDGNNDPNGYLDSTSKNKDGTGTLMTPSSDVTGRIGNGQQFTKASDDHITIDGTGTLSYGTPLTVEAWVKCAPHSGTYSGWFLGKCDGNTDINWALRGFGFNSGNQLWYNTQSGDSTYHTTTTTPADTWVHAAATIEAPNALQIYLNGAPDGAFSITTTGNNPVTGGTKDLTIGLGYPDEYFGGTVDEVRVSNIARSADWLATEYANINTPATISGAEEVV